MMLRRAFVNPICTKCGGRDILVTYPSTRFSPFGDQATPPGFVTHATREFAKVPIAASELVKAFMSCERWVELFPGMICQATIHEQLYSGEAGDPDFVTLLPSGFAVADALNDSNIQDILGGSPCTSGSILTMNLQVLYSNNTGEDPTPDFVKVVNCLFCHTINENKAAINCS
ncbi:hypothetical protein Droror1_Dr00009514 [Drosera rotundifolia]